MSTEGPLVVRDLSDRAYPPEHQTRTLWLAVFLAPRAAFEVPTLSPACTNSGILTQEIGQTVHYRWNG